MTSPRRGGLVVAASITAALLGVAPAAAADFTNSTPVVINADAGNADPYPSAIDVSGVEGYVTDVNVTLNGLFHEHADDFDIVMSTPSGRNIALMGDACNGETNANLTFDAQAATEIPEAGGCFTGSYRPRSYDPPTDIDDWPPNNEPDGSGFGDLVGEDPNGQWTLWVTDDSEWPSDNGKINGGWTISIASRPLADVRFGVAAQTAREGDTVVVDILRGPAEALGAGSIVVATSSGTATAGSDFTPVSQIVSFGPGETTKSIAVPVLADGGLEPEQDFSIVLGQAEGDARAGTPAAVGLTIPADAEQLPDDRPQGNEDKPPPAPFTVANAIARSSSAKRCHKKGAAIKFQPQMPDGVAVMRSEVFVNGRKVEDNIGESAVAPINLTMTGKRMKVRIRLRSHDGRVVNVRRTFRRCSKKRS